MSELEQALDLLKRDPMVTVLNGVEAQVGAYFTVLGADSVLRLYQVTDCLTAAMGDQPPKIIVTPIGQRA